MNDIKIFVNTLFYSGFSALGVLCVIALAVDKYNEKNNAS